MILTFIVDRRRGVLYIEFLPHRKVLAVCIRCVYAVCTLAVCMRDQRYTRQKRVMPTLDTKAM